MDVIGIILVSGVILCFLLITVGISLVNQNNEKLSSFKVALGEQYGDGEYHVDPPGSRFIGISWEQDVLIIGEKKDLVHTFPLASLRDVNIDIDGTTVTTSRSTTKSGRGSQLAGAAVGGVLLGPAGLIIGGLSGSSKTKGKAVEAQKIKSVKLTLRFANRQNPVCDYCFFQGYGEGVDPSAIKPNLERAARFHALLLNRLEDGYQYNDDKVA